MTLTPSRARCNRANTSRCASWVSSYVHLGSLGLRRRSGMFKHECLFFGSERQMLGYVHGEEALGNTSYDGRFVSDWRERKRNMTVHGI